MLIFPPLRWHIDRWLASSVRYALIGLCALLVGLTLFFFLYSWKHEEGGSHLAELSQGGRKASFLHEAIGTGALALRPQHALGWVSRLAGELAIVAYSSRPDSASDEANILIAFKQGKEQLSLSNAGMLYLQENEQGKGLHPSEVATGLWMRPSLLENGAILVEAGRKLVLKNGEVAEEKGQFVAALQGGIPSGHNPMRLECVKQLGQGRGFSQDLLIQKYGGREFAPWQDKVVLELSQGSGTYALFVSRGDYLQYEEGEWRLVHLRELNRDLPVAHIQAVSSKGLEIQAWDETGFYAAPIQISMQNAARLPAKQEMMPANLRLRNATQISCTLGKRRVVVRRGDWLLRTSNGWRNLRRSEEIQQCLYHRLKGELFVFDSIEQELGKSFVKGHLFDETRTHVESFALAIDEVGGQGKGSRKKKQEKRAA